MSLRYQSFNYISNINCCVSKQINQSQEKEKKNPALLKFQSSIINKPSKLAHQGSNGIGIIGGLSAQTSLNFANKLMKFNLEQEENIPPFVLCSDTTLSKELLSLQGNQFPFLSPKAESVNTDDCRLIVEKLRHKRTFLEKYGVSCIVMPCDISHSWYDEIKEDSSVPFLHVGECVAKELIEAKLRPLEAGSPLRIGLLATNEMLLPRFYQEKLENEGFEVILPDKATVEHTMIPAVEALYRNDIEGATILFRIAVQVLLVRAANRVILASDELRQLLPHDDPLWRKCINPMDALARSCIKYAQSHNKKSQ